MTSESDSDIIGEEAEKEYHEEIVKKPAPKRTKLTMSERLRLIDQYRQGRTDKFYSVAPLKNKPGEFRITKRKKPLDIPIPDSEPLPEKIVEETPVIDMSPVKSEPVKEKADKNKEFYAMQTTINNSLSKEIAAVMEKCNKIEAKMKKQKAQMKQQRLQRAPPAPDEYIEEYSEEEVHEQEDNGPEYYQPQGGYTPRYNVRRRIDLRNF